MKIKENWEEESRKGGKGKQIYGHALAWCLQRNSIKRFSALAGILVKEPGKHLSRLTTILDRTDRVRDAGLPISTRQTNFLQIFTVSIKGPESSLDIGVLADI